MTSYQGGLSFDNTGALRVTSAGIQTALTTVLLGNSISTANQYGAASIGDAWTMQAEIHLANMLSGSGLKFPRITASTRTDSYGCYGYSSQTSTTILADLQAQLWTPLQTAGVTPGLIAVPDLFANDIAAATSVTTMTANLTKLIRDVQARYPGVILLLSTPHPSTFYDTAAKVAIYQSMVTYMQSIDNGVNVFVSTVNGYENPASPGTPLSGYTDGVHPNAKGALLNARTYAATLNRIYSSVKQSYYCISGNMTLSGSGAASGTNVTGTTATGSANTYTANGTYVLTAENPGQLITITANAGTTTPVSLGHYYAASTTISSTSSTAQISPFMQVELVSGAENIGFIVQQLQIRASTSGTGVSGFPYYMLQTNAVGEVQPDYKNGDVLTLRMPPKMVSDISGLSGNFTDLQNMRCIVSPKLAGGTFSFRIKSMGVGLVS